MKLLLDYEEIVTTIVKTTLNVCTGDVFNRKDLGFPVLVKKLGKMTIVASSCGHTLWKTFVPGNLGGTNLIEIESITILDMDHDTNRIAVNILWVGGQNTVVILESPPL